jgi:DNA primase
MFDLDRIKAIPIATVAEDLGFALSRSGAGRCRLPDHDDTEPSFSIRAGTNRFICFGCDRRGSVIDLVRLMRGLDFVQACRWLEQNYLGVDAARRSSQRGLQRQRPTPRREIAAEPASTKRADSQVFEWLLDRCPLRPRGAEYLRARGFSQGTIAHFRIGQMQDPRTLLPTARAEFGDERLLACGLVKRVDWGEKIVFPRDYLLFPFLTEDRVSYLQARRADGERKWRWFCLADLAPPIFNANVLCQATRTILLCEGVTDVLSAHELGMDAVGVLGASTRFDLETAARFRGRNLAVVGDADGAGGKFNNRMSNLFARLGMTVIRKRLPPGCNDLNDFLLSTGTTTHELA